MRGRARLATERLEKAGGREIAPRPEGLRPGQMQGLLPHVQVGLVERPPGIPNRHTVLGGDQLLAQQAGAIFALDRRKQRG